MRPNPNATRLDFHHIAQQLGADIAHGERAARGTILRKDGVVIAWEARRATLAVRFARGGAPVASVRLARLAD